MPPVDSDDGTRVPPFARLAGNRPREGKPQSLAARSPRIGGPAAALIAIAATWPALIATSTVLEAKTPGKTYCFYRKCHRVKTLEETRRLIGVRTVLKASHYDDPDKDRYNPTNLTSSGEWFRSGVPDNAASPTLPNGTILFAFNPATRQAAVLRINNAGPYWGDRTLDVSRAAAERLGFAKQGVAKLVTQVMYAPTRADVTYRKGRRYAAVPGYIGSHATIELALADASRRLHGAPFEAPLTPPPGTLGTIIASGDATPAADAAAMSWKPKPDVMASASLAPYQIAPLAATGGPFPGLAQAATALPVFPGDAPAQVAGLTPAEPPQPIVTSGLPGAPAADTPPAVAPQSPAAVKPPSVRTRSKPPAKADGRSTAITPVRVASAAKASPVVVTRIAKAKKPARSATRITKSTVQTPNVRSQVAAQTRKARSAKGSIRLAQAPLTSARRVTRTYVLDEYEALPRPARGETLRRTVETRRSQRIDYSIDDDD